jgi:hypothetical protein
VDPVTNKTLLFELHWIHMFSSLHLLMLFL